MRTNATAALLHVANSSTTKPLPGVQGGSNIQRNTCPRCSSLPSAVLFIHLRKCAGTELRKAFAKSCCKWKQTNYCARPCLGGLACELGNSTRSPIPSTSRIFWEKHCFPDVQHLPQTVGRLRAVRPDSFAFTVLRDPVDLVLSEHHYFASSYDPAEFIQRNPEMLLQGDRVNGYSFLGFGNAHGLSCEEMVSKSVNLFSVLDHVAFVDTPSSFAAIEHVIPGRWKVPKSLLNVTNSLALEATLDGSSTPRTQSTSPPRLSSRVTKRFLEYNGNQSLYDLAERWNRCSARAYDALRDAWLNGAVGGVHALS